MSNSSNQQLREVIADFLEMGHIDTIITMFKRDPSCLLLSGGLIQDERFKVRIGMAVLFEELVAEMPHTVMDAAVPSLAVAMRHDALYVRGDAACLMATIRSSMALDVLAEFRHDPDPQISEIVEEALGLGFRKEFWQKK